MAREMGGVEEAARRINVREAVPKEQLAKLAERSESKRGVVLAKAFQP